MRKKEKTTRRHLPAKKKKKASAGKKRAAPKKKTSKPPRPKKTAKGVLKKKPSPPEKKVPAGKKVLPKKPAESEAPGPQKTAAKMTRREVKVRFEKAEPQREVPAAVALQPSPEETARRRFRVEFTTRKPLTMKKLGPNTPWDELIFAILHDAGTKGTTIGQVCLKAIEAKHTKAEIKAKNITPDSRFHNSSITNLEAVRRYLDNTAYQDIYGYREILPPGKK